MNIIIIVGLVYMAMLAVGCLVAQGLCDIGVIGHAWEYPKLVHYIVISFIAVFIPTFFAALTLLIKEVKP